MYSICAYLLTDILYKMGACMNLTRWLGYSLLFVWLVGCQGQDEKEQTVNKQSGVAEEEQKRISLVQDTKQELSDWFSFYKIDDRAADSLFVLREVWETDLLTFPVATNWHELQKEYPKLFIPSPDKSKVLDIYSYERVFRKRRLKKPEITADSPDSEVAIVDPAKGEKTRLMFCGTPCQFDDGWWRSENEVVVVGLVQDSLGQQQYPAIWQINLTTQEVRQYTATTPAQPANNKNYLQKEVFSKL
ncbi:hypothetical protein [Pontibacter pudoricolor]|uniref:hypothetical protein n=1 Tax=Pontibacter pudoricolor TaxID=2694930 RepID=UPI0013914D80|nr:hypothetical protein [Pontibacter pudoricolor]